MRLGCETRATIFKKNGAAYSEETNLKNGGKEHQINEGEKN